MLPTVVLFSDLNVLSLYLVEALLAKQCRVVVLTKNSGEWTNATRLLSENENFKVYGNPKDFNDESDYFIFVGGFKDKGRLEEKGEVKEVLNYLADKRAKSLFVFPFAKKEEFDSALTDVEIKQIYLGEVYGPRMMSGESGVVGEALFEAVGTGRSTIPAHDAEVFTVFAADAASEISRLLFSYGIRGRGVVLADKTSVYELQNRLGKIMPEIIFVQGQRDLETPSLTGVEFNSPREHTPEALKLTIEWLKQNRPVIKTKQEVRPQIIERKAAKKSRLKADPNLALWFVMSLILFLVSPLIFLALSVVSLKLSFDNFLTDKNNFGNILVSTSEALAETSSNIASTMSLIPVLGKPYIFVYDAGTLVREAAVVGRRLSQTLVESKLLFNGILGDGDYDLTGLSHKLAVNLELLYQDSSFLESEVAKIGGLNKQIAAANVNLTKIRKLFLYGQGIAKRLPVLLGQDRPRTYMILFQNNMELRPTGGFIGSFGLANFSKGKLTGVEFFDVYTADGQLKGHVDPPAAIKDHLGEANWYLRDSNWDPDFETSSQRAEWFLDKELDRSVDGVIAIDVDVVRSILKAIGPVTLTDFQETIDYKNIYEKVQYQAENNFFPGSQAKKNILTSLGKAILERFKSNSNLNFQEIGWALYENLESKHIQVFVHDGDSAKAISSLGWNGEVASPQCLIKNCAAVLIGLIEANLGVDKVNYFIERGILINSFVSAGKIETTITVDLKNNAPAALGVSGRYKNYIRFLINPGAKIKEMGIISAEGVKAVTPEIQNIAGRVEAGALVDITAGQRKQVRFTWEMPAALNLAVNGEVNYLIRKQPGTGEDPLSVKIIPPSGVDFSGENLYNTVLDRDFISRVSW